MKNIDNNEIVKMFSEGLSLNKIAKILGITNATADRRLDKMGIRPANYSSNKFYNIKKKDVCDNDLILWRKSGKSFNEIANITGLSSSYIRYHIDKVEAGKPVKSRVEANMIAEAYNSGMKAKQICKKFNIGIETVYKKLKQANVRTIGQVGYFRLKIPDEPIRLLYLSGESAIKIGKIVGLTTSAVTNRLRKMGIDFKPKINRKYFCNDLFFNNFNAESCYWAGFLAADGCISKNTIKTELAEKDKHHLEKLSNVLSFTGELKESLKKGKKYVGLSVTSKKIVDDLKFYFNIVPKKSLILCPPNIIPIEYIHHFIRGYMDGDGCITDRPSISFVGTKAMLEWIKKQIQNGGKHIGNPQIRYATKKSKVYSLSFSGRIQDISILEWLFNQSVDIIRLDRKFELAEYVMSMVNPRRKPEVVEAVKNLYLLGYSFAKIKKEIGVGYTKARAILTEQEIAISRW